MIGCHNNFGSVLDICSLKLACFRNCCIHKK
jgi:hypothetical protein